MKNSWYMIVIIVLIGTVVLANSYETFEDGTSLNIVLVIFAIFIFIVIIIVAATNALSNAINNGSINNALKNVIKNMPASNFANNKRFE